MTKSINYLLIKICREAKNIRWVQDSHIFTDRLDDDCYVKVIDSEKLAQYLHASNLCSFEVDIYDLDKLDEIADILEQDVKLRPYEEIAEGLAKIEGGKSLFLDPGRSNKAALSSISEEVSILEGMNLTTLPKALKNETEVSHIREVMIKDGVAMCKFLIWLENHVGKEKITEVSAAEKLEAFRAEQKNFKGPSFGTIAGYKGNGAIVHYSAEESSCAELQAEGIFLLDSGGQYLDGTTDITRTVALSESTAEEKRDFTLVLKGHIGIATAVFPAGTRGQQIEASARRSLWKYGLNYGHGTGHGVGFFLLGI